MGLLVGVTLGVSIFEKNLELSTLHRGGVTRSKVEGFRKEGPRLLELEKENKKLRSLQRRIVEMNT